MTELQPASRPTIVLPLSRPVEWLGNVIKDVAIQEPSAATFFEIGAPQIVVHSGSGAGSLVDVPTALQTYVQRCVKVEQADRFLLQLPLKDGMAIKKAILGFFHDAPEETSS